MSLLSVHVLMNHVHAAAAAVNGVPADALGFGAMLGRMSDKSPSAAATNTSGSHAKDFGATAESATTPDAATLSALQSLEAALSGLAPPAAPAKPPATSTTGANSASTPLGTALDQAAGALSEAAATGQLSIKGMLQADPSLGLTDVQMRTFLGVTGATPARAGTTPLSPNATWSRPDALQATNPALAPPASATKPPAPTSVAFASAASATIQAAVSPLGAPASTPPLIASPMPDATRPPAISVATVAPAAQPRRPTAEGRAVAHTSTHGVDPTAASGATSSLFESGGSTSAHSGDGDSDGGADASGAAAPVAATEATNSDGFAATSVTVALADLPAFLCDQASSLTAADGTQAPSASPDPATPAAVRTAQAVKELKISLDPADLGEMTVKLRLANGKLSVSIAVVNPSTLGAIQDDRELIAARLAGGGQTLENLAITRQSPATQEASQTNAWDDNGGGSSDERASNPDASQRPPSRSGAGGGGFGAFLV